MDTPVPVAQQPPQEWLDAIAEAEEDVAAGRVSPWPEVRGRLLAMMAEFEAARAKRQA